MRPEVAEGVTRTNELLDEVRPLLKRACELLEANAAELQRLVSTKPFEYQQSVVIGDDAAVGSAAGFKDDR